MAVRWPVTVMVARTAVTMPVGELWRYEPKADGARTICLHTAKGRVQLQSRQQRPLIAFPDIVDIVSQRLPPGTVVDGELVLMTGSRIDFQALQRRLASRRVEAPATLVVFDLLAHNGQDLRSLPQAQRRHRLEQLIATWLAMVAEFEADLIRLRTKEGMRVAKAKGRLRGRRPKLNARQEAHLVSLIAAGEHSIAEVVHLFRGKPPHGLPRPTAQQKRHNVLNPHCGLPRASFPVGHERRRPTGGISLC